MATFAQVDKNNVVVNVIKVPNDVLLENGIENEQLGIDYLREIFPWIKDQWIQTWFGTSRRGLTAGIGMIYDKTVDRFTLNPDVHGCTENDIDWDPLNLSTTHMKVTYIEDLTEEEKQALLEKMKNVSVQD